MNMTNRVSPAPLAVRDLLKKDNPDVILGYAERGEDSVKVIAEAIRPVKKKGTGK